MHLRQLLGVLSFFFFFYFAKVTKIIKVTNSIKVDFIGPPQKMMQMHRNM